jgi:HAD superfamily hydrolase (TIGR01509 family)
LTHPEHEQLVRPAVLLDLDGTLIDSVYQHVLAWRDALEAEGIDLPVWGIHRRVGMSGGLLARALLRETGKPLSTEQARRLQEQHEQAFARYAPGVRPLPGARELLETLSGLGVPWAIATSGRRPRASWGVQLLAPASDPAPLITHDDVSFAKPDPDLFLAAAAALGARIEDAVVVGDSVWDLLAARRARALGVGLLSGGYGREELERAGAFRVYQDPQDLLDHLDEIGIRRT